ncbi:hypothetical protein KIPB_002894 [Kipferlia bialata]|uniref:Uncharacterized protein n=1 Tax=Kipferlia bialata TaxID=797122 RepID=A0A9K3CT51_9EUKA|nr:hypothetical protein KIPB_002894 [Kipferlia bialata]|eukprot:g2894.t1
MNGGSFPDEIWDSRTARAQLEWDIGSVVNSAADVYMDESIIMAGDQNGRVSGWSLRQTGMPLCTKQVSNPDIGIRTICISQDNTRAAYGAATGSVWVDTISNVAPFDIPEETESQAAIPEDLEIDLFDDLGYKGILNPHCCIAAHSECVTRVMFSHHDYKLATCSGDRTVRLWVDSENLPDDLHSLDVPYETSDEDSEDSAAEGGWEHDSETRLGRIYGARQARLLYEQTHGDDPKVGKEATGITQQKKQEQKEKAASAPGSKAEIEGSTDGDAPYTWYRTLEGHREWVWDCAFSLDDDLLVTGSADNMSYLWHLSENTALVSYAGHMKPITALALQDIAQ